MSNVIEIKKPLVLEPLDIIKIIDLIDEGQYECIDLGWGKAIIKKQINREEENEINR